MTIFGSLEHCTVIPKYGFCILGYIRQRRFQTKTLKTQTLEELTDKYIGKRGTSQRDTFDYELNIDLIGEAIREARIKRNLTQSELGELVGVQKAQISKLENSLKQARVETIIKVFTALNARLHFTVEML
jgi:DNA-binding XRE family transcriptional regulator